MMIFMDNRIINVIRAALFSIIVTASFIMLFSGAAQATQTALKTFASPEEAFDTLIAAVQKNDVKQLAALFGPWSKNIYQADNAEDADSREGFLKAYTEKHRLEKSGTNRVFLHVGEKDWPWPVPVVRTHNRWRFDTEAGIREVTARRIGRNEVAAVQVSLAYVDAQLEYVREHTAGGIGEYAQKLSSDPGQTNGLCWNAKDDEKPSLLGPQIAYACTDEMTARPVSERLPYHGYYYRILKRQGKDAPGGAYDYVVDKKMIGGFALVAYPAVYGVTGITTFIVNKDDVVYQKDLGKNTKKIAEAMTSYNPDAGWRKVD